MSGGAYGRQDAGRGWVKEDAGMVTGAPWFRAFARRFPLPDRYVVFDVETTGSNAATDAIVQMGYLVVDGGRVVSEVSCLLNWFDSGVYDPRRMSEGLEFIRNRIEFDRETGRPTGRVFPMTVDKIRSEGIDPVRAVAEFNDLFRESRVGGFRFVAHCGYALDQRMLAAAFGACRVPFTFGPDDLYDTGAMEKACQTGDTPAPLESLDAFMRRVLYNRKGSAGKVKYNLSDHAYKKYDLGRCGIDPRDAHDALADCRLTYHLFETFRALSEGRTHVPTYPEDRGA